MSVRELRITAKIKSPACLNGAFLAGDNGELLDESWSFQQKSTANSNPFVFNQEAAREALIYSALPVRFTAPRLRSCSLLAAFGSSDGAFFLRQVRQGLFHGLAAFGKIARFGGAYRGSEFAADTP